MVHVWSINSGERFQGHDGPLVYSIFSFSHNVSKRLLFQGCHESGLCDKELLEQDLVCSLLMLPICASVWLSAQT